MRKLPVPDITSIEIFRLCAASVRDRDLKRRLGEAEPIVEAAENRYRLLGVLAQLHSVPRTDTVGGYLSDDDMDRLYNNTFVRSEKTRATYAKLKKACVNDICPLCGQGRVSQLDHFLPFSNYAVFGLTALNLVPACSDCNKEKLAHFPATAGEQTLHPYFDDVGQERWLFAEVIETAPAVVAFRAVAPDTWDNVKAERIATHFRVLKLAALYATYAAVEINNMRHTLRKMAATANSVDRIRAHLREREESSADVFENSWQRATFDALASSDWFCTTGFDVTG